LREKALRGRGVILPVRISVKLPVRLSGRRLTYCLATAMLSMTVALTLLMVYIPSLILVLCYIRLVTTGAAIVLLLKGASHDKPCC